MGKLFENTNVIDWIGVGPCDLDTDRTADYVNVENYRRAMVILTTAAGTAGDDWNLTIREADDASGTNAQDSDIVSEYWIKQAATNLLSTATFTRSTQTADALISGDATSAEQVSMCVLDLDLSKMTQGKPFLSATLTLDASGGAQYGQLTLVLYDARHPQRSPLGSLS